ncbi:MAG TPA: methionine--tRNA ligase [Caulobacterales bacterium]|nr:methionine--tRNA ligase [Caulobacterales bacterium]
MPRILITSALPYINGVKHLGNLVGSMLPADVHARFRRMQGHDVLFVCATDEHGTPTELAARAEGIAPAEFCAKWHLVQKDHCARFLLSFDVFGRSSSPQNHKLTQDFAQTLWEHGFLEQRTTKQVYSPADGRFLPDRYVIGTCPHCGYEAARGDQCENCTRVLDPPDLINPRSAVSGSPDIEIRESKHLFLRQSLFAERIRAWIGGKLSEWPNLVTSIAMKWLDEGLQDRGITRDLEWGVPVNAADWGADPEGKKPDAEGLRGKVFYVWFDAPIEYIGATWEWADTRGAPHAEWERWWRRPEADDVTYVQFMGKDNVPFHTVGFPCTLFGVNEQFNGGKWIAANARPWKFVDRLKGFNWLNYYGGKFSTSAKRGVFMDQALDVAPADVWRWRLIASAPESADSAFTWEDFQTGVNADLANVLGNFVNRITRFCAARFDSVVPPGGAPGKAEEALAEELDKRLRALTQLHEAMEFRKAAAETRAIWVLGNEYLQSAAPWTAIKTDMGAAAVGVRTGLNLCVLFAQISAPFMPETAAAICRAFGLDETHLRWPDRPVSELLATLGHGAQVTPPDVLFRKIEDEDVAAWKARFGGEG